MSCARKGIEMKIAELKAKGRFDDFSVVGVRFLKLCREEFERFFLLPKSAETIFIEIHDHPAKDRLAICIKGHTDYVGLYSMEKNRPHISTLWRQEDWLYRHLKFGKTYYVGLWFEGDSK